MFRPHNKILVLVTGVLLLPSCATVRDNQFTPTTKQRISLSTDPATTTTRVENSAVVKEVFAQESDDGVVRVVPIPSEILPLPERVVDVDDESGPLDLDDLEQMALANNPGLIEAWQRVEATRGKWIQSGLPPNPRLGYSGQQLGSGGQAEQQGVYVEQELIRGGKLRLNRAVASQEISHAEQLLEVQRRRVLTDVRTGYYNVLCAQKRLELTEELVRIGKQATATVEKLLEKQEVSRRDLLQARIESKSSLNFFQQARNQQTSAWRMLVAVLGSPEMPPRILAGELGETATELEWERSMQRLLSESPEISAMFVQVERARWQVERAYAESVPDVNLQGIIQHDNSTGSSNGSILVSIPIPILNWNQGGIHQAESELVAAQRAAERVELGLQRRLAPVFERFLTGRNRVKNYHGGILRDAKESLDLTKQGYEAGELSFLNLLTAQRTYFQANLDFVKALGDMWSASAEIEGMLLMDSLEKEVAFP